MEMLSIEERIRNINTVVPIYRTINGQIDLELVLGIGAYRSPPRFEDPSAPDPHAHAHEHNVSAAPHTHKITGISSLRLSCPTLNSCTFGLLDEWIRTILWENRLPWDNGNEQLQVLRCKGYFHMDTGEEYMLQGVRSIYELRAVETQGQISGPSFGKLVLIGKGLNDTTVRQSFESIFR